MNIFGLQLAKEIYMPIIIIVVSIVLEKVIQGIIKKTFNPAKKHKRFDSRKLKTLRSLFCNVTKYVIWVLALLSILSVFGVNTAAIITGLGVVSLVIGLAFQDILKDILVGVSILFENQFAVGDLVDIGGFQGTVISLGLKSTRIKAYTGEVKIISNRNITEVINYSLEDSLAVIDFPIANDDNSINAEKILRTKLATLKEKIPGLIGEIELLGIQNITNSSIIYRITAKCKATTNYEVERLIRKEIQCCLYKNDIKSSYIEVHNEK